MAAEALAPSGPGTIQADVEFAREPGGATYVRRQRVGYPFHLGRALSSPGDPAGMPTLYLQSCSGGVFEGDDLRLRIEAGEGASAHVTTGAATIVHSMDTAPASQRVEFVAREGSFLEYLPDPTILFPRSQFASSAHLCVHPGATVILGESLLLHDPQGGDGMFDWLRSETRITDAAGRLLVCDRFRIEGSQLARGLPGIVGTSTAQGSLFIASRNKPAAEMAAALRETLSLPGVYGGAASLPNQAGAWARILATDAAALKAAMFNAWSAARGVLTGSAPMQRRK